MKHAKVNAFKFGHTKLALNLFAAHYRQAPLQAAAILIGIVLAVTLFVAVQAINLNAKRSYAESTEQLSAQAQNLIIQPAGQNYLPESLYFTLRQQGLSAALPVIEGRARDEQGRRWSIQGSELITAITSRSRYASNNDYNVSLFDSLLPLPELVASEPIVMMSQSQYRNIGEPDTLVLDDIKTQVAVLPDEWQLGSRMLMDIGFAQRLLNKQGQLSYIAVFDLGNDTQAAWQKYISDQGQWITNNQSTDLGSLTDSFHLNLTPAQPVASHLLGSPCLIGVPFKVSVVSGVAFNFSIDSGFVTPQLFSYFSGTNSLLSERRNHIPFVLSEVRVFHVFYFLAGANFMIIASHCFYVQRCRTSYLNPSSLTVLR